MITLEDYVVNRLERLETATEQFEILNKDLNSENIRLKEMLAAIGEKMCLSPDGNAIWMDSIFDSDFMFKRIVAYCDLKEKWEAKYAKENS